jgi:hypothetical protein
VPTKRIDAVKPCGDALFGVRRLAAAVIADREPLELPRSDSAVVNCRTIQDSRRARIAEFDDLFHSRDPAPRGQRHRAISPANLFDQIARAEATARSTASEIRINW